MYIQAYIIFIEMILLNLRKLVSDLNEVFPQTFFICFNLVNIKTSFFYCGTRKKTMKFLKIYKMKAN